MCVSVPTRYGFFFMYMRIHTHSTNIITLLDLLTWTYTSTCISYVSLVYLVCLVYVLHVLLVLGCLSLLPISNLASVLARAHVFPFVHIYIDLTLFPGLSREKGWGTRLTLTLLLVSKHTYMCAALAIKHGISQKLQKYQQS